MGSDRLHVWGKRWVMDSKYKLQFFFQNKIINSITHVEHANNHISIHLNCFSIVMIRHNDQSNL